MPSLHDGHRSWESQQCMTVLIDVDSQNETEKLSLGIGRKGPQGIPNIFPGKLISLQEKETEVKRG